MVAETETPTTEDVETEALREATTTLRLGDSDVEDEPVPEIEALPVRETVSVADHVGVEDKLLVVEREARAEPDAEREGE